MNFVRCVPEGFVLNDAPVHLRGMGIGNWLLPEGYMWRFMGGATSPRRIEAMIESLIGEAEAHQFWQQFRANFFTQQDVAAIAGLGFDHIRLPLNARMLISPAGEALEAGFSYIDQCLDWAAEAGLLVLLDLHGAPGGQTGTNIDDSARNLPELFTDQASRALCRQLWRLLAQRYRRHPALLGYDLLNEPLPEAHRELWGELVPLYRELTAEIRAVDEEHLLMYEGAHWATNFTMFDERLDDNACLQFHHYWAPVELRRFAGVRAKAAELGMPVYLGESGENSAAWIRTMFGCLDDLGISWNFWPWKKLATDTSPCDAQAPEGWEVLVAYAEERGPAPSKQQSQELLGQFLHNILLENCHLQQPIIDALGQRSGELPVFSFRYAGRGPAPESEALRSDEGRSIVEGEGKGYPWSASPEERATAPEHQLQLAAGEEVIFEAVGAAALEVLTNDVVEVEQLPGEGPRRGSAFRVRASEPATLFHVRTTALPEG